ncbi:glycosyl transferase family 2 [Alloscardovia macacae]|uniref:dolichyl-phosphate beta-glucosyltransferase n=1 Tax=Alloscardovia macacae TaxID=1160091 RepID=A0A1Y2SW00_9BIFI|nr:dolichyl-phosphate beta-glucosyltransferase [Alloscardovia macacae]OTA27462.1 glycosyl transferase family 2 [Alloscardovia macacae]OTA28249.1 glycosyl transferase family 2 [Alloscardovia macacae]
MTTEYSTTRTSAYTAHITDSLGITVSPAGIQSGSNRLDVDFVIPVYNEEKDLERAVTTLSMYLSGLRDAFGTTLHETHAASFTWNILIADNASTDSTWDIACTLVQRDSAHVRAIRLDRKGRGFALKTAWLTSPARVLAYMDVDLSTGLEHIDSLVGPLLASEADVSLGSRLRADSTTTRSAKREFISRTYNLLLRTYSGAQFSDAQCGFKAIRADTFRTLLPTLEDNEWFFDTELLLLAQAHGFHLHEVGVRWIEDPQTSVHILDTVLKDLRGMQRVKRSLSQVNYPSSSIRSVERQRDPILRGSIIPVQLLVSVA